MKRKKLCGLLAAVLCFGLAMPVCAAEGGGFTITKSVSPAAGTTPDANGAYVPGDKVTYTIEIAADPVAMLTYPEVTDALDANLQVDPESVTVNSTTLTAISSTLTDGVLSVRLDQKNEADREDYPAMWMEDEAVITFDAVIKDSAPAGTIANRAVLQGREFDPSTGKTPPTSNEVTITVVVPQEPEPEPEPVVEPEPEIQPEPEPQQPEPEQTQDNAKAIQPAVEEQNLDASADTGDNTPLGAVCLLGMIALAAGGLVLRNRSK